MCACMSVCLCICGMVCALCPHLSAQHCKMPLGLSTELCLCLVFRRLPMLFFCSFSKTTSKRGQLTNGELRKLSNDLRPETKSQLP